MLCKGGIMAKKYAFPDEIAVTVEEMGSKDEFLLVHPKDCVNYGDGEKVAIYGLIEVRTCRVTTVLE
jgi:hypothetical protein